MALQFTCPHCRTKQTAPESAAGSTHTCTACGGTFNLAQPPAASPITPEPAPRRRGDYEDEPEPAPRRRRRDDDDDYDRPPLLPHRGGSILAMGIIAFFCFGIILGPIAWIQGSNDLRAMREGRMDRSGEGQTRAGMICGIIATVLAIIVIVTLPARLKMLK